MDYSRHARGGMRCHREVFNGLAMKQPSLLTVCLALASSALFNPTLVAATSPAKRPAKGPTAVALPSAVPSSQPVIRGNLKPRLQVDGVFEALEMEPLKLAPKIWQDLQVVELLPPGAKVRKGDVIVKLETERLKDQIDELEWDRPNQSLTLETTLADLDYLKATTPLRLEAAKKAQRNTTEDLSHFELTGKDLREKSAKFNLKSTEQYLANQQEELRQLEKMYKADDLTEETEEIVLKRQKFEVERAQFTLESSRTGTERELNTAIPRELDNQRAAKKEAEYALSLAEQNLPRTLTKRTWEADKLKRDMRKAEKRLADLKADLDILTVRSPIDGVIYYGACQNGKWTTAPAVLPKLIPGGRLTPNEIFITVVNPERLRVRSIVSEADWSKISMGTRAQVMPTTHPERKLSARVEELGNYPLPMGGYETVLSFDSAEALRLVPGMTCKIQLSEGQSSPALLVPKAAVFLEGTQKVVFVSKEKSSPERRLVRAGDSDDTSTEILEGVTEGERVLLNHP